VDWTTRMLVGELAIVRSAMYWEAAAAGVTDAKTRFLSTPRGSSRFLSASESEHR